MLHVICATLFLMAALAENRLQIVVMGLALLLLFTLPGLRMVKEEVL